MTEKAEYSVALIFVNNNPADSVNNCRVKQLMFLLLLHHSLISHSATIKTIIQAHSYKPVENITYSA